MSGQHIAQRITVVCEVHNTLYNETRHLYSPVDRYLSDRELLDFLILGDDQSSEYYPTEQPNGCLVHQASVVAVLVAGDFQRQTYCGHWPTRVAHRSSASLQHWMASHWHRRAGHKASAQILKFDSQVARRRARSRLPRARTGILAVTELLLPALEWVVKGTMRLQRRGFASIGEYTACTLLLQRVVGTAKCGYSGGDRVLLGGVGEVEGVILRCWYLLAK